MWKTKHGNRIDMEDGVFSFQVPYVMDASKYIEAKYIPPPSKKYVWTRGGDRGDGSGHGGRTMMH